jgi:hypothetical protein
MSFDQPTEYIIRFCKQMQWDVRFLSNSNTIEVSTHSRFWTDISRHDDPEVLLRHLHAVCTHIVDSMLVYDLTSAIAFINECNSRHISVSNEPITSEYSVYELCKKLGWILRFDYHHAIFMVVTRTTDHTTPSITDLLTWIQTRSRWL